ncbi:HNH endonuclease [Patescibacteria group bacterium]
MAIFEEKFNEFAKFYNSDKRSVFVSESYLQEEKWYKELLVDVIAKILSKENIQKGTFHDLLHQLIAVKNFEWEPLLSSDKVEQYKSKKYSDGKALSLSPTLSFYNMLSGAYQTWDMFDDILLKHTTPEELKDDFLSLLYGENKDIADRINTFQKSINSKYEKINDEIQLRTDRSPRIPLNLIGLFLACVYPDKFYFYKATIYRDTSRLLGMHLGLKGDAGTKYKNVIAFADELKKKLVDYSGYNIDNIDTQSFCYVISKIYKDISTTTHSNNLESALKSQKSLNIKIGQLYSKDNIESAFETNFGARIKGITLRKWSNGTPYIILFSRAEGGDYTDEITGNSFYYEGEGTDGDQTLTVANNTLTQSRETNRLIYGFRQESAGDNWKYIGLLELEDYEYIERGGRMVYEFRLQIKGIENPSSLAKSLGEVEQLSKTDEPKLTSEDNSAVSMVVRKSRGEAFRRKIKVLYENSCAVCSRRRFTKAKYPEVESAHIYPVEKNGSDDLRNGLALCRLHHWAFDGGLFSIDENLKIIISPEIIDDEEYEEIWKYQDRELNIPFKDQCPDFVPHQLFVQEHRKIHGFN